MVHKETLGLYRGVDRGQQRVLGQSGSVCQRLALLRAVALGRWWAIARRHTHALDADEMALTDPS